MAHLCLRVIFDRSQRRQINGFLTVCRVQPMFPLRKETLMRGLMVSIVLMAVLLYVNPLLAADAGAGKDVFAKKCASCHGAAGEGKETIAKMFQADACINDETTLAERQGEDRIEIEVANFGNVFDHPRDPEQHGLDRVDVR